MSNLCREWWLMALATQGRTPEVLTALREHCRWQGVPHQKLRWLKGMASRVAMQPHPGADRVIWMYAKNRVRHIWGVSRQPEINAAILPEALFTRVKEEETGTWGVRSNGESKRFLGTDARAKADQALAVAILDRCQDLLNQCRAASPAAEG